MAYTYTPVITKHAKSPALELPAGSTSLTASDLLISRLYHPSNGTNAVTLPSTVSIIQALNMEVGDAFNFTLRNTGSGTSTLTAGDGFTTFSPGGSGQVLTGNVGSFTLTCSSLSPPGVTIDSYSMNGGSLSPYDNLVVYMSTTGNDANDGLTPATAVLTLQGAQNKVQQYGYNYSATVNIGAGVFPVTVATFAPPNIGLVQGPITYQGTEGVLLSNVSVVGSVADPNYQNMQTLTLQGGVTLPALPSDFTTYQGLWIRWKSGGSSSDLPGYTYTITSGTPGGTTFNITEFTTVTTGTIDIIYPMTNLQRQSASTTPADRTFLFPSSETIKFQSLQFDGLGAGIIFSGGNLIMNMVRFKMQLAGGIHAFATASLANDNTSAGPSFINTVQAAPLDRGYSLSNGTFNIQNGTALNTTVKFYQCEAIMQEYFLYSTRILIGQANLAPPPASFADVNMNSVVGVNCPGHQVQVVGAQNYAYFAFCSAINSLFVGYNLACATTLWFCTAIGNACEGVRAVSDSALYISGGTYTGNGTAPSSPYTNNGIYMTGGSCLNINSGTTVSSNVGSGIVVVNGSLNVNTVGGTPNTVTCNSNQQHGIQLQNGSMSLIRCTCNSNTLDGVNIQGGTAAFVNSLTFSSNLRDGIRASNCKGLIQGGTGTSNTGYGLNLIQNASFGVNNTQSAPTGTAGAVKVGVNAVATWATIVAGATASCTDVIAANPNPAFCNITPTQYTSI